MSGAGYVVAAHAVVLLALMVYVVVAALRTARLARETQMLVRLVAQARAERPEPEAAHRPTVSGARR